MKTIVKNSYDIVGEAVTQFWKDRHFAEPVIAFFYQKYDYEDHWEWYAELVECFGADNYDHLEFAYDFCEGQTCVKDITIATFEEVTEFYAKNKLRRT